MAHPPAEAARPPAPGAQALIDLVVRKYAPAGGQPDYLARLLGYGAPHMAAPIQAALRRAREQLASCRIDGTVWYWPADENPRSRRYAFDERLRLLAPFDPVVWDRRRFTLFWDWTYKFEAYAAGPASVRLRAADALAGPRDRLGQSAGARRQRDGRSATWPRAPGAAFRARWTRNCSAWGSFSRRADAAAGMMGSRSLRVARLQCPKRFCHCRISSTISVPVRSSSRLGSCGVTGSMFSSSSM